MAKRGNKEQLILNIIKEYIEENSYPPSIREICTLAQLNSPSTVHMYIKKLEEKGLIIKDGSKTRALRLANPEPVNPKPSNPESTNMYEQITEFLSVPVLGYVAAGEPILAEENVIDTFPLPMSFANNKEVFMLKIRGDSMINVGIMDDDYVIVEQQQTATNGDMVVALVEDSATVKTFYKENGYFRLQPENDDMEPIIVNEVMILGKVTGVFRIY